jgi:hypothetical protein
LLYAPEARAQVVNGNSWPRPRLTVLTPCGGKVGTTFEVTFSGTDLDMPESLYFSHPGITARSVLPPAPKVETKPAEPKGKMDGKKKSDDKGKTEAKAKDDKKKPAPLPPVTKFTVTIDDDVPPGYYDVRFVGKDGVSNPRVFVVGVLNEVAEKEPNNDFDQAQKVPIGTTVTGAISSPTDVDYTAFTGRKGQRVTITCLCASIDSRLYPELSLIDPSGRKMFTSRPLPERDGVIDVTLPEDGDYTIRLVHFTYTQGGPEFFYRLNVSTAPWIEAVFPPMVEPGKTAQVTLYGHNLPGGVPDPTAVMDRQVLDKLVVNITAPRDPEATQRLSFSGNISPVGITVDGFEYRLPSAAGPSNPVLIAFAKAPVVLENDNNDAAERAQEIQLPCEVAGRIDKKGDHDWYVMTCKKGDTYNVELFSHRLGAPTMMYVKIRNQNSKPPQDIVSLEENNETLSNKGLYTVTRDPPLYKFTAPADGKYTILVGSHLGDLANPAHVYRLRISPEKPDFRLVVMPTEDFRPDAGVVGQGGLETYTVFVARQDNFKGEIHLSMEGLPIGVTCPPQVLAANMKSTHLVVSADHDAPRFTGEVRVIGMSLIGGRQVRHEARPASITWATQPQQNIPTITRLDKSLLLAVRDRSPARLTATPDRVVVRQGDKLDLMLKLKRLAPDFKGNFQVTPVPGEFPPGMNFGNLTFAPGKDDQKAVLAIPGNLAPGNYNLVFRGFAPIASNAAKNKPVNTVLPSNPVYVTVVPKQVANLSVSDANPTVKPGAESVVVVRVARLFDYQDAFKVQVVLPQGMAGITAGEVTIPAGENEAKLTVKVAGDAAPGRRENIIVRASAVLHDTLTLAHETKINVNVAK